MRRAAAKHGFHGDKRWHGKRISACCDESVEKQREIPIFEKAEIYEGEIHFSEKVFDSSFGIA